jgi:cAMP-binding proteins - catabolite gene activator and regulatory subunit of cAMP-dependent protein kinases
MEEQREFLANHFTLQNYKKNEIIHCEGETPTCLMCLLNGKVKIYKDGVGGRSQIIRMIKPTEYFGYRRRASDTAPCMNGIGIIQKGIASCSQESV